MGKKLASPVAYTRLAANIRDARLAKNLSKSKTARLSDMALSSYTNIERGSVRNPRVETVCRIAAALGVAASKLMKDVDSESFGKPGRKK